VTLTEVLAGSVDPNLVRDRIVLIGVTAPSINDYFLRLTAKISSKTEWRELLFMLKRQVKFECCFRSAIAYVVLARMA
jgi:hypothetical protein